VAPIVYPEFLAAYSQTGTDAHAALGLSNLLIFGQDLILFAGSINHHLAFTGNYAVSDAPLWQGLLVPQAWSLGLELSFYLLAPFILRRLSVTAGALAISMLVRAYLYHMQLAWHDPWSYRFFPAELCFFLAGAISQQIWLPYCHKIAAWFSRHHVHLDAICTSLLLAIICWFNLIPINGIAKMFALFGLFVAILPFAFIFQDRMRPDRLIGELSYPLYICHFLVINTLAYFAARFGSPWLNATSAAITASLLFAICLDVLVARRVEQFRAKLKSSRKAQKIEHIDAVAASVN
jgi:peptidoglycan/LPS O-acetylase OafA/YrhL